MLQAITLIKPVMIAYEKLSSTEDECTSTNDLEANVIQTTSRTIEPLNDHYSIRSCLTPRTISDAVLGLSDGMTVPFALTAGLSELGDTRVVVLAGLAELVAGAISMGFGGYLGAKSEEDIYNRGLAATQRSLKSSSQASRLMRVASAFGRHYTIPQDLLTDLAKYVASSPCLPKFLMRFESNMDEVTGSRALTCAFTIATGYFVGGFIPLLPYLLVSDRSQVSRALLASVLTMIVMLFLLGYGKACLILTSVTESVKNGTFDSIKNGVKGGVQMLLVGGISAGCAVVLVKTFNSSV